MREHIKTKRIKVIVQDYYCKRVFHRKIENKTCKRKINYEGRRLVTSEKCREKGEDTLCTK